MTEGANNADDSSGSSREFYRDLLDRIKILGIVVASIIIDLLFVGIWVALHQLFDIGINFLSSSEIGLNKFAATVLEYTFTVCTLTVVVVYVIADLIHSVRSVWKKRGDSDEDPRSSKPGPR